MITIILNNSGGELDRRQAYSAKEAARMVCDIVSSAGELYDGDSIVISGEEERDDA